jgi:hypothetical protein
LLKITLIQNVDRGEGSMILFPEALKLNVFSARWSLGILEYMRGGPRENMTLGPMRT